MEALTQVWREQKGLLETRGTLALFSERLAREFAIETGILERLYTLDRGVTVLLIEHGLDAALIPHGTTNRDPEFVAAMIRDQHAAVESLFDFVKRSRQLSTGYIKELHALLTLHQATTKAQMPDGRLTEVELIRGDWKKIPNNPQRSNGTIHLYCPPEHVASEMDRLIDLHSTHLAEGVSPEVEAAWLHHRFTQIHPFQDGNGRVARCLASLVLIRSEWFPLVIDRDDIRYIAGLEEADKGSLSSLVELVTAAQRKAFVGALSLTREVERAARVSHVIRATREDLENRRESVRQGMQRVRGTADSARERARSRLEEVRGELTTSLGDLRPDLRAFVDTEPAGGERGLFFRHQVVETAKELRYFANFEEYHSWARLVLKTEAHAEILISFHGLGREYLGVLATSACFFRKGTGGEDSSQVVDLKPVVSEVFQLNYAEDTGLALNRFSAWLDDAITRGLDLWRRGL